MLVSKDLKNSFFWRLCPLGYITINDKINIIMIPLNNPFMAKPFLSLSFLLCAKKGFIFFTSEDSKEYIKQKGCQSFKNHYVIVLYGKKTSSPAWMDLGGRDVSA